jgi:hypothetical protein
VENAVEVRYAGVVVGRGALVRELGPDAAFVGISEPLPVGTLVTLKIGDAVREAWVDEVVESSEPSAVGMRVRWGASAPAKHEDAKHEDAKHEEPKVEPASSPESGPTVDTESSDEGSGALAAPAGSPDDAQAGGGKRRRKRR